MKKSLIIMALFLSLLVISLAVVEAQETSAGAKQEVKAKSVTKTEKKTVAKGVMTKEKNGKKARAKSKKAKKTRAKIAKLRLLKAKLKDNQKVQEKLKKRPLNVKIKSAAGKMKKKA